MNQPSFLALDYNIPLSYGYDICITLPDDGTWYVLNISWPSTNENMTDYCSKNFRKIIMTWKKLPTRICLAQCHQNHAEGLKPKRWPSYLSALADIMTILNRFSRVLLIVQKSLLEGYEITKKQYSAISAPCWFFLETWTETNTQKNIS